MDLARRPTRLYSKYLNDRRIPQLFVATGADKWGNYSQFPYTIGWSPSYRIEAQIYAKYILAVQAGCQDRYPLSE